MSYLLMIVEQRGGRVTKTPEEAQQRYDDMMAFGQSLADQGLPFGNGAAVRLLDGWEVGRGSPDALISHLRDPPQDVGRWCP